MATLTGVAGPLVLCPFSVVIEPMAAMVNFEIAGDPTYTGLEIQRFDDLVHGTGIAVLLMRRDDRRVDVYRQPGLRLDPSTYDIGAGVGLWAEADLEPAVVEVTPTGVLAEVGLHDSDQRWIRVQVDDRDGARRRPASLLAPVSAAVEQPTCMLLVWMSVFDLVRTGGRGLDITIDGRSVTTGRLPMAWLHRRRLVKYAADLVVIRLNPAQDGPVPVVDPGTAEDAQFARVDGQSCLAGVTGQTPGHTTRLVLDPPLPDLGRLPDGASVGGEWHLGIDGQGSVVGGTWHAERVEESVALVLDSTAKWRPGPLPLLMRVVTRIVPTFREWPATYRWRGTITLGPTATITSAWERKGSATAESYRRMMRA